MVGGNFGPEPAYGLIVPAYGTAARGQAAMRTLTSPRNAAKTSSGHQSHKRLRTGLRPAVKESLERPKSVGERREHVRHLQSGEQSFVQKTVERGHGRTWRLTADGMDRGIHNADGARPGTIFGERGPMQHRPA